MKGTRTMTDKIMNIIFTGLILSGISFLATMILPYIGLDFDFRKYMSISIVMLGFFTISGITFFGSLSR